MSIDSATIFINDEKWLASEPCVDVRYGTQCLPHGSWVVGFVVLGEKPGEIKELLDKPFLEASQEAGWDECVKAAREAVRQG